jgi:hypothetical protein
VPGLDKIKLKAFTDDARIDITFGAQFTTRKLYQDCFRLNIAWELSQMHDPKRTVEQALLELIAGVCNNLFVECNDK